MHPYRSPSFTVMGVFMLIEIYSQKPAGDSKIKCFWNEFYNIINNQIQCFLKSWLGHLVRNHCYGTNIKTASNSAVLLSAVYSVFHSHSVVCVLYGNKERGHLVCVFEREAWCVCDLWEDASVRSGWIQGLLNMLKHQQALDLICGKGEYCRH